MRLHRNPLVAVTVLVLGSIAAAGQAGPGTRFDDSPPVTVPPTVQITCPAPSGTTPINTLPSIRIRWDGTDPDGVFTRKPIKYKYILLGPSSEFPRSLAIANPDSLRRYYADHPLGPFAGWDSTGADTTRVQFTNLIPGQEYVFAVIAIDEAGDYSRQFGFTTNMLRLRVTFAGFTGPRLTLNGPGFHYQYPSGGYCVCASAEVPVDVFENRRVTFQWFADPDGVCEGADIRAYRWALDIEDVADETPRTNEETDVRHWSIKSLSGTSATIGPFVSGQQHKLYVEVEDNAGLKSLGILRLTAIPDPNRAPDCAGAVPEPRELWPPNRSFVPVNITGVSDPDGDAVAVAVTRVTQDEAPQGNECDDAIIDSDGQVELRAESIRRGNGRVYTVWFTATDENGASCDGSVQVRVPHDRGHSAAVDDGQRFSSLGPCSDDRRLEENPEVADAVTLSPAMRAGNAAIIRYSLAEEEQILVAVYDVSGRRVATLENAAQGAGAHEVRWDTASVPNGMYFCRLQAGAVTLTRSLLILR